MLHARSVVVLLVFIMYVGTYILDCASLKTFDAIYTDRHNGKFIASIYVCICRYMLTYTDLRIYMYCIHSYFVKNVKTNTDLAYVYIHKYFKIYSVMVYMTKRTASFDRSTRIIL